MQLWLLWDPGDFRCIARGLGGGPSQPSHGDTRGIPPGPGAFLPSPHRPVPPSRTQGCPGNAPVPGGSGLLLPPGSSLRD